MYNNGDIVTLAIGKTHGEMSIRSGICGQIVQVSPESSVNHRYIVDFGPEGQWHCVGDELDGDDHEGWDEENGEVREISSDYVLSFDDDNTEKLVISAEDDIQKRMKELERS